MQNIEENTMKTRSEAVLTIAEAPYRSGYVWSISLVAALGGLFFGYDWAAFVISITLAHARPATNGVEFDLQAGRYNLIASNTLAIGNANVAAEGWSSSDPGYRRKIVYQDRDGLPIECTLAWRLPVELRQEK